MFVRGRHSHTTLLATFYFSFRFVCTSTVFLVFCVDVFWIRGTPPPLPHKTKNIRFYSAKRTLTNPRLCNILFLLRRTFEMKKSSHHQMDFYVFSSSYFFVQLFSTWSDLCAFELQCTARHTDEKKNFPFHFLFALIDSSHFFPLSQLRCGMHVYELAKRTRTNRPFYIYGRTSLIFLPCHVSWRLFTERKPPLSIPPTHLSRPYLLPHAPGFLLFFSRRKLPSSARSCRSP